MAVRGPRRLGPPLSGIFASISNTLDCSHSSCPREAAAAGEGSPEGRALYEENPRGAWPGKFKETEPQPPLLCIPCPTRKIELTSPAPHTLGPQESSCRLRLEPPRHIHKHPGLSSLFRWFGAMWCRLYR